MAHDVKNVVFDLGGVLIDWNPRYLYKKVFFSPQAMEHFLTNVCNQEWNEKQDAGCSFAEGITELVAKFPQFKKEIEIYDTRWDEMLNGPIPPVVQMLEKISAKKKHRLIALTNWSKDKFHVAEKNFPFLNLFEGIVVSGKIGLKKPDPQIFQHMCKTHAMVPQHTAFIDDSLVNIEAAAQLGFRVIHYTTPEELQTQLNQIGII